MKTTNHFCTLCAILAALTSCEKPLLGDEPAAAPKGNVVLTFSATGAQTRAAAAPMSDHFQKLNVMLFSDDGTKYFDKVRTQYATDENFGQMSLTLPAGEYTVVAVGHSSAKSATIKSPELVQFTASDGQKLTDTFCYAGTVAVADTPEQHVLTLNRVAAMVRFQFTDDEIPAALTHIRFDYTGGSANFNPTTSEGTTKSTQSETRPVSPDDEYQVFTFPYLSSSCTLKVTVSALAADGTVIKKRTLDAVPVTRNRITTFTGPLFADGEGTITQSGFGFTVNSTWDGEDRYDF
ncbi:MAG: FimB/Mfa2 family fimbrial subunit [Prevotella sp.]|nr:FimB/Mfa2 family fimbrial subunit [Prevotella sp.]